LHLKKIKLHFESFELSLRDGDLLFLCKQEIKWLFLVPIHLLEPLASPAMGHWGTCSPSTFNCLIFGGQFRAAQTLTFDFMRLPIW